MSNRLTLNSGPIDTLASTAKTIAQLAAPAQVHLDVEEVSITFNGTVSTHAPVLCELMYQGSAGTPGGTGGAVTPAKNNQNNGETIQSSGIKGPTGAGAAWTAEPTAGDVIRRRYVHPQGGFTWVFPPGREVDMKGGSRLAVRCTDGTVEHLAIVEFVYRE